MLVQRRKGKWINSDGTPYLGILPRMPSYEGIDCELRIKNGILHGTDELPAVKTFEREEYYYQGIPHRGLDMPYLILALDHGFYKEWVKYGKYHRENNQPARVWEGCIAKMWYYEGQLHRLDGPAVIYSNGSQKYFVNGIEYTEEEYNSAEIMDIRASLSPNLIKSAY